MTKSQVNTDFTPDNVSSRLRTIAEDPPGKEAYLSGLGDWITPTDSFYVRSHFAGVPNLDPNSYRLNVTGSVEKPFSVSYEEILALPTVTTMMTMECAGNSRSFVSPAAEGIGFNHGAVGNARWTGVPLSQLLSRAGIKDTAVEVLFEGADIGEEEEEGQTIRLKYARSLPVSDALSLPIIIAYEMNEAPLEPHHGFPVRLIVPGWYGMASVKWLKRIEVLDEPFTGFFQKRRYVLINEGESEASSWAPLTKIRVKSLITHPRHGEVLPTGHHTIRGVAWSGNGEIVKVDVSTNNGDDWHEAVLIGKSSAGSWCQWEYEWQTPVNGHYILTAKATDDAGEEQPISIPWNFRGYGNNARQTLAVEVSSR